MTRVRTLVIALGDQLDLDAAAFDGFDPAQDAVWMAEADEESTHVWSSKQRIAIFLTRREKRLAKNARMALQVKNVARLSAAERTAVTQRADAIRQGRVGTPA